MGIPLGLRRTVGYTYDSDWDCGPTKHTSSCSKKEEDDDDDCWYYAEMRRAQEDKDKLDSCIRIRLKYGQWYGDDQHGEYVKDWNGKEIDLRKWRREKIRKNTGHYW